MAATPSGNCGSLPLQIQSTKQIATVVLKAARTVLAQNPAARFLLVGTDTDKLDLTETERTKIICTGRRKDINALLNAMDTFILTSAYGEGFPNVLGEALAVGLPCISTDVGDARDLLVGHGTVIPKQDAETLSSNILGLLEELQAQKLKSPERRQYIVENFDIPILPQNPKVLV